MNRGATKVWQVLGTGEGFVRNGVAEAFELAGFVHADNAADAWRQAVSIASSQWPELAQADCEGLPRGVRRAVINADEIQDARNLPLDPAEIDQVQLIWEREGNDV